MASEITSPEKAYLTTTFTTLLQQFTTSPITIQKWTTLLLTTYTEPHRHYHTTTHVTTMLQHLEYSLPQINNPTAVTLAIIFHNWEYIPHSPPRFNEEQSIVHFEFFAAELPLPSPLIQTVKKYILATISHKLDAEDGEDGDLRLFLDFDLEVLGRERGAYEIYREQIRKEYVNLRDEVYREGRKCVLERLLARDRLFFSERFYERFEKRARENLMWEIGILKGQGVESVDWVLMGSGF